MVCAHQPSPGAVDASQGTTWAVFLSNRRERNGSLHATGTCWHRMDPPPSASCSPRDETNGKTGGGSARSQFR